MEDVKLNNGIECPVIGIGTFMLSPDDAENSVREALKMGYRLVDTANAYVNERAVGRAIKANLDIMDFTLTDDEMEEIAGLDKGERYYVRTEAALASFAGWKPAFERE